MSEHFTCTLFKKHCGSRSSAEPLTSCKVIFYHELLWERVQHIGDSRHHRIASFNIGPGNQNASAFITYCNWSSAWRNGQLTNLNIIRVEKTKKTNQHTNRALHCAFLYNEKRRIVRFNLSEIMNSDQIGF